jgi:hypothetical protein
MPEIKQLHIDIPVEMWEELKRILPDKGLLSALIRRMLSKYIEDVNAGRTNILI